MDKREDAHMDVYWGTAEDLSAAGIVSADHLPPHPGCSPGTAIRRVGRSAFFRNGAPAAYVRRFDVLPDSELWMRVECLSDGRYEVAKGLPREERLRRRREIKAARAAEAKRLMAQNTQDVRERMRRRFANMSEDAFREQMAEQVKRAVISIASHCADDERFAAERVLPHTLPAETVRAALKLLFQAVEVIEASAVVVTADPQLAAARDDASFQAFLEQQCIVPARSKT